MGTKTRKQLFTERTVRGYIHCWKLQNNPAYIDWYKRWEPWHRGVDPINPPEIQDYDKRIDFGLAWVVFNPFKTIDWTEFIESNKIDYEIIHAFRYEPVLWSRAINQSLKKADDELFDTPILRLALDLNYDKKEILDTISTLIDFFRKIKNIKPFKRDFLNKFPLYAQVWDLRKGPTGKKLREISKMLKTNVSTVKSRFYRAFQIIYNRRYDAEIFKKEIKNKVYIEQLERTCKDCPKREKGCNELCPDVIGYYLQDDEKQREGIYLNPEVSGHRYSSKKPAAE
jgi:hypothetical protein